MCFHLDGANDKDRYKYGSLCWKSSLPLTGSATVSTRDLLILPHELQISSIVLSTKQSHRHLKMAILSSFSLPSPSFSPQPPVVQAEQSQCPSNRASTFPRSCPQFSLRKASSCQVRSTVPWELEVLHRQMARLLPSKSYRKHTLKRQSNVCLQLFRS